MPPRDHLILQVTLCVHWVGSKVLPAQPLYLLILVQALAFQVEHQTPWRAFGHLILWVWLFCLKVNLPNTFALSWQIYLIHCIFKFAFLTFPLNLRFVLRLHSNPLLLPAPQIGKLFSPPSTLIRVTFGFCSFLIRNWLRSPLCNLIVSSQILAWFICCLIQVYSLSFPCKVLQKCDFLICNLSTQDFWMSILF